MNTNLTQLILDDRSSGNLCASNGILWRIITDKVMGGVSAGRLLPMVIEGRSCIQLTGNVSLEKNGGFVQASLDLSESGLLDATGYVGIEIQVFGNDEKYNLHLRTDDTRIVWQSYRTSFHAPRSWVTIKLPFDRFQPHRIDEPFDRSKLRRLGIVSIGREMQADVCIARLCLYS